MKKQQKTTKNVNKPKRRKRQNKDSVHYVNNVEFTDAIVKYVQEYKQVKAKNEEAGNQDEPLPQMSNYIGDCILKIATRLSYSHNFINYTYREEMISDGIENCVNYITNFDPSKSTNGFAYVTQICYYAFIRRIEKEKKQQRLKFKLIEEAGIPGLYDLYAQKDSLPDGDPNKEILDTIQLSQFDVDKMAEEEAEKAKKKKKKGLENLM
jgi:hypothetical protein